MPQQHPDRVITKQTVWITTAITCVFLLAIVSGTQKQWMPLLRKNENPKCSNKMMSRLCDLGLQSDDAGLREWMKKSGSTQTADCVESIDGRFDRFGQARMEILRAVVSLKNEGLSFEEKQAWSKALNHMAQNILRPGKTRREFLREADELAGAPEPDTQRQPATN